MPKNRVCEAKPIVGGVAENAIRIGSRTTVELDGGNLISLMIGMRNQGDPESGIVSCDAPLARAIIGHQTGEVVSYSVGEDAHLAKIIEILI